MPPLNPDRWRALSPYLDEALAMTSDRRGPWLAEIRAGDAALGADLESLLAEHEHLQESRYLERPVALVQHSAAVQLLEDNRRGLPPDLTHRPGRHGWRLAGGAL
jgi:hypothetical protein